MKIYSLETGNFKTDGGAMFGVVPKVLWQRLYTADENNLCNCSCRSLLIETNDRKILIDTGIGDKLTEDYAKHQHLNGDDTLMDSLAQINVKPEDITDIILSHLHFDHCGGTTKYNEKGEVEIVFPNAKIWVSKTQWDWANDPNPREKPAYLPENLEPLEKSGQIQFIEENMFLTPDIEIRIFNGHTVGLLSVFMNIGERRLVFAGDLIPALPYIRLSFTAAFDINPLLSITEKTNFLNELCENGDILFLQHDINTEACTLKMTPKGVREDEHIKINELDI